MNASVLTCQIPSAVKKACLHWHSGRISNMHRLATVGMFSPEKLLAEVENRLKTVSSPTETDELNIIKEYAEQIIDRDVAELALYRAAQKVVYSSNYTLEDALEYFRLCFQDFRRGMNDGY